MIPNKWIILWDGIPVGIRSPMLGESSVFETEEIKRIAFFDTFLDAQIVLDRFLSGKNAVVKEIQFRIVG
jgi:hypothetical protein